MGADTEFMVIFVLRLLATLSGGARVGLSHLISPWFENIFCMIVILLNLLRLMTKHMGYLGESTEQAGKDCLPGFGVQSG